MSQAMMTEATGSRNSANPFLSAIYGDSCAATNLLNYLKYSLNHLGALRIKSAPDEFIKVTGMDRDATLALSDRLNRLRYAEVLTHNGQIPTVMGVYSQYIEDLDAAVTLRQQLDQMLSVPLLGQVLGMFYDSEDFRMAHEMIRLVDDLNSEAKIARFILSNKPETLAQEIEVSSKTANILQWILRSRKNSSETSPQIFLEQFGQWVRAEMMIQRHHSIGSSSSSTTENRIGFFRNLRLGSRDIYPATAGNFIAYLLRNKTVEMVNLVTGKPLELNSVWCSMMAVGITPNAKYLIGIPETLGSNASEIWVQSTNDLSCSPQSIAIPALKNFQGNNVVLTVSNNVLVLNDRSTGEVLALTLSGDTIPLQIPPKENSDTLVQYRKPVAISPDERLLIMIDGGNLHCYDLQNGAKSDVHRAAYQGDFPLNSVAFLGTDRTLVAVSDHNVLYWSVDPDQSLHPYHHDGEDGKRQPGGLGVSTYGNHLITWDSKEVRAGRREPIYLNDQFRHSGDILHCAVTADGGLMMVTSSGIVILDKYFT